MKQSVLFAMLTPIVACAADPLVATGTVGATLDAVSSVRDAVQTRILTRAQGQDASTLWANATGNETRTNGFGNGYRTRIMGATLGADIAKGNGFFGVAYSGHTGKSRTRGTCDRLEGDLDAFSILVYGALSLGPVVVSADTGWQHARNAAQTGLPARVSMHTTALVLDAGLSLPLEVKTARVTPYVRVNHTRIDPSSYRGMDGQFSAKTATLVEIPVGVRLEKDHQVGAWTVTPAIDIAYAARTGDKSIRSKVDGKTIRTEYAEDGLFSASFGVTARGEKGSIGLVCGLRTGQSDRRSYSAMLTGAYTF